ncbi:CHAT domain-containing protein [Nocardia sienata]|uniref:CHAT domain-containing protein n=1 Tax=Nocardia sienata TaxID=248552 RepID=UPI0007A5489B|nr:CHAT domain-containing protein [Nocardia sienata]
MTDREHDGGTGGSGFFTAAKSLWQQLGALAAVGRSGPFGPLDAFRNRLNRAKTVAELDDAIRVGRQLVADTPAGHPAFPGVRYHLARALVFRFGRTNAAADLDEAIRLGRRTLDVVPADVPFRTVVLIAVGSSLDTRFENTGDLADLDDAVLLMREAVARTADGDPELADRTDRLGAVLLSRVARTGQLADLDEAIALGHRAVAATAADDPLLCVRLVHLAAAHADRYARTGAAADLDEAIRLGEQTISAMPATLPDSLRTEMRHVLGQSVRSRFERTGDRTDADEAIRLVRQAVTGTPAGDPGRADSLDTLRGALLGRFERTGTISDLNEAVEAGRQAVAASPAGHPDRARDLFGLGFTLRIRFERTGNPADLDEAIRIGREAVAATVTEDPDYSDRASSLGRALVDRFHRTGSMTDLDEAIRMARRAVVGTAGGSTTRAGRLTTLGTALRSRYERSGRRSDLDEAITSLRAAVDSAPAGYRTMNILLVNLGNALSDRFEQTTETADLEAAIDLFRQSVAATPADHPDLPAMLSNLGFAIRTRFEQTRTPTDLDEAIDTLRRAANITPADHPAHAQRLTGLGAALMMRYWRTDATRDRYEATTAFLDAQRSTVAPPSTRILAARAAADLVAATQPDRAAELIEHAVRLLPEIAPRQLERSDQQYAIGRWGGFAADAAALTLRNPAVPESDRADLALRLLEAGRAVLLNRTVQVRTDTAELMDRHPDLGGDFVRLREQLDRPDPTPFPAGSDDPAPDRHRLAREFEEVLTRIRAQPGFETFALPPSTGQLVAQAGHGPVVAFGIGRYGSDALLLTADGISWLPLPALSAAAVRDRARAFREALNTAAHGTTGSERQAAQRQLSATLEWLWDNATGPVLEALGFHRPIAPDRSGPRVWWAPGGLLGQLPIHAAGYHTHPARSDPATVMDRVVSSYTPTVAALEYARRRRSSTADLNTPGPALVVAMPTTPGIDGRLHYVLDEARLVATHLPGATVLTEPDDVNDLGSLASPSAAQTAPMTATVLDLLPERAIVHFACHAATDPDDPSRSRLLLHDHATTPFTVAALAPIHLDRARLAYLSACDTAISTDTQLVDESIHLASAFQLAGYSHVIGTLWTIDDDIAIRIADAFYTALRTGPDTTVVDIGRAPHALHHAVRAARDTFPATPSLWAAHLHTGA